MEWALHIAEVAEEGELKLVVALDKIIRDIDLVGRPHSGGDLSAVNLQVDRVDSSTL